MVGKKGIEPLVSGVRTQDVSSYTTSQNMPLEDLHPSHRRSRQCNAPSPQDRPVLWVTHGAKMVGGRRLELPLARFQSEVLVIRRTPECGGDGRIRTCACRLPTPERISRLLHVPKKIGEIEGIRTLSTGDTTQQACRYLTISIDSPLLPGSTGPTLPWRRHLALR